MAVIFYLSSDNTWTSVTAPPQYQLLRKAGHVFEYALLALLLGRALVSSWALQGRHITRTLLARAWCLGALMSALYAVTDEIHQSFVPRREFHLTDILIDALSATGALGVWYIARTRAWARKPRPCAAHPERE